MSSTDDRQLKVRACVAEAAMATLEEVTLTTLLVEELAVDSLTLLDIVFRLEEAFDIEITRGQMEQAARGDMTDEEFAPDGVISEAGLVRLRDLMPESTDQVVAGLRVGDIYSLFTVLTLDRIVASVIAEA